MGEVYEAGHVVVGRRFVLKLLHPHLAQGSSTCHSCSVMPPQLMFPNPNEEYESIHVFLAMTGSFHPVDLRFWCGNAIHDLVKFAHRVADPARAGGGQSSRSFPTDGAGG